MFVQKVAPPGSRVESWTVLGADDAPVAAIESYLSYLSDIERSPNTVKAYAHDLKDYFVFLAHHGIDWREVRLEDVGEFVAWLRLPPAGRSGQVSVLPSLEPHGHGQPEAVGSQLVLCPPGTPRGGSGRAAGDVVGAGQVGVKAVSAPHQQERSAQAASDRVEDAAADPSGADRVRGADDFGCVHPAAGPVVVRGAL